MNDPSLAYQSARVPCRCFNNGAPKMSAMKFHVGDRVEDKKTHERGRGRCQHSTLSSTISARNLPCSVVMRPTVMGRRKRRGPALPGLKKSVPFFVSILGWCE